MRNARVRSISNNQCTHFCGFARNVHSTYYSGVHVSSTCFWVLFFGTFCKEHTTVNNASKGILGNHHRRVVSPRETWYPHKQQLAAGSLAAEPRTLRASSHSPHIALEPTLLALDPNPRSHRHPRRTPLRHVRRRHLVTREETKPIIVLLVIRMIYKVLLRDVGDVKSRR